MRKKTKEKMKKAIKAILESIEKELIEKYLKEGEREEEKSPFILVCMKKTEGFENYLSRIARLAFIVGTGKNLLIVEPNANVDIQVNVNEERVFEECRLDPSNCEDCERDCVNYVEPRVDKLH